MKRRSRDSARRRSRCSTSSDALDERTVAIHAIYLTDDETGADRASGARVDSQSDDEPIPRRRHLRRRWACRRCGVTMGLGTDADVRPSLIDEMRAGGAVAEDRAPRRRRARRARRVRARHRRRARERCASPAAISSPGAPADYVVLDASQIDRGRRRSTRSSIAAKTPGCRRRSWRAAASTSASRRRSRGEPGKKRPRLRRGCSNGRV